MMTFAPPVMSSHDGVKSMMLHKMCTPEGVAGICRKIREGGRSMTQTSSSSAPFASGLTPCPLRSSVATGVALSLGSPLSSSLGVFVAARRRDASTARSTSSWSDRI